VVREQSRQQALVVGSLGLGQWSDELLLRVGQLAIEAP
jgi:hypothetical protein